MSSPEGNAGTQGGEKSRSQPPPLPAGVQPLPLPQSAEPSPSLSREAAARMNPKMVMFLFAVSVPLAGYLSCLIASHVHWSYKLLTAQRITGTQLRPCHYGMAAALGVDQSPESNWYNGRINCSILCSLLDRILHRGLVWWWNEPGHA